MIWARCGIEVYKTRLFEVVLAMTKGATIEDFAHTSHAHPAMGEAVKEACLDALGCAIHT